MQHHCPNCYSVSTFCPYSVNGEWPKLNAFVCGSEVVITNEGLYAFTKECPKPEGWA